MEDKLNEFKNEYCKWYCEYKGNPETKTEAECPNGEFSEKCGECENLVWVECTQEPEGFYYPCENCKVDDFIRFVRNSL